MPKARVPSLPFARQPCLIKNNRNRIDSRNLSGKCFNQPMRSHVCSFAELSLWIMDDAVDGAAPATEFGTAVAATAGETMAVGVVDEPLA